MERSGQYAPPGLLIRHMPESRRQRMARLRTTALAVIATIAASGVALQEINAGARPAGQEVATGPSPFDFFPG
jgi:hypothetical protein